jgi:hypothetical protein
MVDQCSPQRAPLVMPYCPFSVTELMR